MKTLLLSLLLLIVICKVGAQFKFTVQAAVLSSKYKINQTTSPILKSKSIIGVKLGVMGEVPVSGKKLYFAPELNGTLKGYYYEDTIRLFPTSAQFNKYNSAIFYLEVPLTVLYKLHAESRGFIFGIGPVIGFGLGGKAKKNSSMQYFQLLQTTNQKVIFDGKTGSNGENYTHFKRVEIGAKILAGYSFDEGVRIYAEYRPNFTNVSNAANTSFKNQYFGFTIGYTIMARK